MVTALQTKFNTTRDDINASLIDRDDEVCLALTALLAKEHVFFGGDPGTAKSMMCDTLAGWVGDDKAFTWLMSKSTDPNEILGGMDVPGFKVGDHRRITHAKLPEAHIAFLDEIWKGSSATLNTVLKIMNERKFQNGLTLMDCPLEMLMAASNEYPTEAKELSALFDRFMFRKWVNPVTDEEDIERLMFATDLTPTLTTTLSIAELNAARQEARMVSWSAEARTAITEIRRKLTMEGVLIGDRRKRKSVTAVQCYAWLNGNSEVKTDDLEILSHMWWVEPKDQPAFVNEVVTSIAKPSRMIASQLLGEANEIYSACKPEDLESATNATRKLGEIVKKLATLEGPKAKMALDKVNAKRSKIRMDSFAAE